METKIYTSLTIEEAGQKLREGQLVSFPTETVYGLGALASNNAAVKDVYRVKGRPSDNPLIIHVASKNIKEYVEVVPEEASQLMDAFWPGPLTLILKGKEGIFAPTLTTKQGTVALRMPNQPLTLHLIEAAGFPLVGPSANISGKPSPTTTQHVLHDLNGKIAGVLEGGATDIGVESTVLDLTNEKGPVILRPGAITTEEIETVLRRKVRSGGDPNNSEAPIAPGMKYTHYSPKQPVYIMNGEKQDWLHFIEKLRLKNKSFGILASDEMIGTLQEIAIKQKEWIFPLGRKEAPQQASQRFYSGLRYFDDKDIDYILVEAYPKKGIGEAFMNRLEKASSGSYPTGLTTLL